MPQICKNIHFIAISFYNQQNIVRETKLIQIKTYINHLFVYKLVHVSQFRLLYTEQTNKFKGYELTERWTLLRNRGKRHVINQKRSRPRLLTSFRE